MCCEVVFSVMIDDVAVCVAPRVVCCFVSRFDDCGFNYLSAVVANPLTTLTLLRPASLLPLSLVNVEIEVF